MLTIRRSFLEQVI